ncbi:MAG: fimbrillin family protein [Phocaeicola sp.]
MRKKLFIAALTSIALVGCSNNETLEKLSTVEGTIAFDAYAGKTTRAAITTNANFEKFTVYGYKGNDGGGALDWGAALGRLMVDVTVEKKNDTWYTENLTKWPAEGTNTQFVAFSPNVVTDNCDFDYGKKPNIVFTAPTAVADQHDLVVATSAVIAAPASGTKKVVDLNFSHALSKISASVAVTQDIMVSIDALELCNLGSVATYTYDVVEPANKGSWSSATTLANYPMALNAAAQHIFNTSDYINITATEGAPMVIPQKTTAWETALGNPVELTAGGTYFKIRYKMKNNQTGDWLVGAENGEKEYINAYFPVAFDFAPNKAYNYQIKFGDPAGGSGGGGFDEEGNPVIDGNLYISFNPNVIDWESAGDITTDY